MFFYAHTAQYHFTRISPNVLPATPSHPHVYNFVLTILWQARIHYKIPSEACTGYTCMVWEYSDLLSRTQVFGAWNTRH